MTLGTTTIHTVHTVPIGVTQSPLGSSCPSDIQTGLSCFQFKIPHSIIIKTELSRARARGESFLGGAKEAHTAVFKMETYSVTFGCRIKYITSRTNSCSYKRGQCVIHKTGVTIPLLHDQ